MPNRKVSHLRAKLEGGSVGETFDVVDEEIRNSIRYPFSNTIFVGDSYATYQTTSWVEFLIDYLNVSSYKKLSQGGSGFVGYNNQPFLTLLQNGTSTMTADEKNNVTAIIVGGGTNDGQATTSDLSSAISNFKAYCDLEFPNAKVYVCFIGWSRDKSQQNNIINAYKNYLSICPRAGMTLYADCGMPLRNYTYLDPNSPQHPTQNGEFAIAVVMAQALLNGHISWKEQTQFNISASGHFAIPSGVIRTRLDNGVIDVVMQTSAFGNGNSSGTTALSYNNEYTIATYNISNIMPIESDWVPVIVVWNYQKNIAPAEIRFSNGNIKMKWRGPALSDAIGGYMSDVHFTISYLNA